MNTMKPYRLGVRIALGLLLFAPVSATATAAKPQKFDVYNPLPNRVWATLYAQTLLNPRTIVGSKWANPGKVASFVNDAAGAFWIRIEIKTLGDNRGDPQTICDTTAEVRPGESHFLTAHLSGTSCWISQT